MATLAPIIDSQYRTARTYQAPKREEPVRFYERGRVEVVVVQVATKSEGAE